MKYREPAFPISWMELQGMSLRDWFAGQALAGHEYYGWTPPSKDENEYAATLASQIYRVADAMLAEREKNETAK